MPLYFISFSEMENVKVPVKCAYTSVQWAINCTVEVFGKNVVITSIQIKVKLKYNELGSEENRSQCKVSLFPQMF